MATRPANESLGQVPNIPLLMRREPLQGIPEFPLPPGFEIVSFSPGREADWLSIHRVADPMNHFDSHTFDQQFGTDQKVIAERQLFLIAPDKRAAGTATAWFEKEEGRVHWVAIVPEFQGKGLSKPLLSAVCRKLLALGHQSAFLTTSSARIAAIGLYTIFGFLPVLRTEEERAAWSSVPRRGIKGESG